MATKPKVRNGKKTEADTTSLMMQTIIGTTWRMFVPTIGLTLVGLAIDMAAGTRPWMTISGICLGFAAAFALVWLQILRIKAQKGQKK